MAGVRLKSHQEEALEKLRNGCILNGTVGSGKSRTGIAYYYTLNGGQINTKEYVPMKATPMDLYIITTARKRDELEWEHEFLPFFITSDKVVSRYRHNVVVDSWNNIQKYRDVKNSFFIFDEQRVIGSGAWVKAFLEITKHNEWILLTATPGDTWTDYVPVFIANGFYRNKTDFYQRHAVFTRFANYPKIEKYVNESILIYYRSKILIHMGFERKTIPHHEYIICDYDRKMYDYISKTRWNIYKDAPIVNAGEFCYTLRKLVNSDPSRTLAVLDILKTHPKAIIFYSYDYELDILRNLFSKDILTSKWDEHGKDDIPDGEKWAYFVKDPFIIAEWNGHKHQKIPDSLKWVYLVEYLAGSEGWNCILTDTIIFYSQNYSYRIMHQASGRIDRLNTPFIDLYYYHFRSNSKIDLAIRDALNKKKKFNQIKFAPVFERDTEKKEKN